MLCYLPLSNVLNGWDISILQRQLCGMSLMRPMLRALCPFLTSSDLHSRGNEIVKLVRSYLTGDLDASVEKLCEGDDDDETGDEGNNT